MKSDFALTARPTWLDLPTDAPAASARNAWIGFIAAAIACSAFLLLAIGAPGLRGDVGRYSVTVPVDFTPHDSVRWAIMTAGGYQEAQRLDPTLPDPGSIGWDDAASLPPADPAQLRDEAFTGPAAKSYVFRGATALDRERAHYCLTAAIYYEAASESEAGMRGVAQTVLNRVRHPSFPNSICAVVFQGSQRAGVCQFTFACDGAMARAPSRSGWSKASRVAAAALAGNVFAPVGLATHYHTQSIWPRWGKSLVMTNVVGAHIFHRWRGRWGMPDAFRAPYAAREPLPGPYLPVAEQLLLLNGKPGPVTAAAPGAPDMPAAPVIAPLPGTQLPAAPRAAPDTIAPAPAYEDPRLDRSGQVREEYRRSGQWIR